MTTRLPTQQRAVRESRTEPLLGDAGNCVVPSMHFKVAEKSAPQRASESTCPTHTVHAGLSRSINYILQNVRTAIPLFSMDCLGLLLCLISASAGVSFIFATPPAALSIAPLLLTNGLVFLFIYALLGLYPGIGVNPIVELKSLVMGTITAGAVLAAFTVATGNGTRAHATFITILTATLMVVAPLFRCNARAWLAKVSWWRQPALIIGNREACLKLAKVIKQKASFGLHPYGMIQNHASPMTDSEFNAGFVETLHGLPTFAIEHNVFWALIAPDENQPELLPATLQYCNTIPNVVVIPGLDEFPSLWNRTQDFGGVLGICYRERLLDPWSQICKRIFDVTAVLMGGLLLSPFLIPLMLFTWICMKINSPGPIFYGQERVGKNGRHFQAWKFRTMIPDAEAALAIYLQKNPDKKIEWDLNQKLKQDPRVIAGIGSFLRKTSLDELPQLWNVLVGEMSLVGPRPFMTEQTQIYGERMSLYQKVRPGITGLWQISGRNHTTFEERAKFDAYYVRNWSFWLDIFILGRTVKTVLFREGAF